MSKLVKTMRNWEDPEVYEKYANKVAEVMLKYIDSAELQATMKRSMSDEDFQTYLLWENCQRNLRETMIILAQKDFRLLMTGTTQKMMRNLVKIIIEFTENKDFTPKIALKKGVVQPQGKNDFEIENDFDFLEYQSWYRPSDGYFIIASSCKTSDFWSEELSPVEASLFNLAYVYEQSATGEWVIANDQQAINIRDMIVDLHTSDWNVNNNNNRSN